MKKKQNKEIEKIEYRPPGEGNIQEIMNEVDLRINLLNLKINELIDAVNKLNKDH